MIEETLLHDLLGAQRIATVNKSDVRRMVCEVEGFLDGGVTATHNAHGLAEEKEPVAGAQADTPKP